jgi:hypothetical protein
MMFVGRIFARLFRPRARGRRGAVMVEYAFLLVAVGVPAVVGLAAGGRTMFKSYQTARNSMLSPFP